MLKALSESPSMPRRPRLVIPEIPLHITQRGINRAATFLSDDDYQRYHEPMVETAETGSIRFHAYAPMGNHVHLPVTRRRAAISLLRCGSSINAT